MATRRITDQSFEQRDEDRHERSRAAQRHPTARAIGRDLIRAAARGDVVEMAVEAAIQKLAYGIDDIQEGATVVYTAVYPATRGTITSVERSETPAGGNLARPLETVRFTVDWSTPGGPHGGPRSYPGAPVLSEFSTSSFGYPTDLQRSNVRVEASRTAQAGGDVIEVARRIVQNHQAEEVNGVLLDAFTASAIVQVFDGLNPANQQKLRSLGDVTEIAAIVWKVINRSQGRAARARTAQGGLDKAFEEIVGAAPHREPCDACDGTGVCSCGGSGCQNCSPGNLGYCGKCGGHGSAEMEQEAAAPPTTREDPAGPQGGYADAGESIPGTGQPDDQGIRARRAQQAPTVGQRVSMSYGGLQGIVDAVEGSDFHVAWDGEQEADPDNNWYPLDRWGASIVPEGGKTAQGQEPEWVCGRESCGHAQEDHEGNQRACRSCGCAAFVVSEKSYRGPRDFFAQQALQIGDRVTHDEMAGSGEVVGGPGPDGSFFVQWDGGATFSVTPSELQMGVFQKSSLQEGHPDRAFASRSAQEGSMRQAQQNPMEQPAPPQPQQPDPVPGPGGGGGPPPTPAAKPNRSRTKEQWDADGKFSREVEADGVDDLIRIHREINQIGLTKTDQPQAQQAQAPAQQPMPQQAQDWAATETAPTSPTASTITSSIDIDAAHRFLTAKLRGQPWLLGVEFGNGGLQVRIAEWSEEIERAIPIRLGRFPVHVIAQSGVGGGTTLEDLGVAHPGECNRCDERGNDYDTGQPCRECGGTKRTTYPERVQPGDFNFSQDADKRKKTPEGAPGKDQSIDLGVGVPNAPGSTPGAGSPAGVGGVASRAATVLALADMYEGRRAQKMSVQCMECGKKFKTSSPEPKCPGCGGYDVEPAALDDGGVEASLRDATDVPNAPLASPVAPENRQDPKDLFGDDEGDDVRILADGTVVLPDGSGFATGTMGRRAQSGYTDCACRDCFDVAINGDGEPALCGLCQQAGCDVEGASECQRDDAYGVEGSVETGQVYAALVDAYGEVRRVAQPLGMPPSVAGMAFERTDTRQEGDRIVFDVAWNPETVKNLSGSGIEQQIRSFVLREVSNTKDIGRPGRNFGFVADPRIEDLDVDGGIATVSFASSEVAAPQLAPAEVE
jgi:predicted  nucleic acid-binding Zn-ribbon protein